MISRHEIGILVRKDQAIWFAKILFVDSSNQDTDLLQTIIDQLNLLDHEDEAGGVETVGEESSLASTAPSTASDILPATALDKPKEKVCGVKGESKYWKTTSLTGC